MKVLHLISGGDIGGAKTHMLTLLKRLNACDSVEPCLLCVLESSLTRECEQAGIRVKIIPQKWRGDVFAIMKMSRWIGEEKFDIIHCHGARANFIALFLRLLVKSGRNNSAKKTMVTTVHSDYMKDFQGAGLRSLIFTGLNAFSLRRFTRFVAISDDLKQVLVGRGFDESRIEVIYNGVDFTRTVDVVDKTAFLAGYGVTISDDTPIIGCVTRLHLVKGVDILLKAAKILKERGVNFKLLIAGSGDEKENLLNYVNNERLADAVTFLGHIQDVDSFYNAIDINVLTSRAEGFGLTLAEGARFRLITVASNTGGIKEIITDNVTGKLFETGNYNELAGVLEYELANLKNDAYLGDNLYNSVRERFSDDVMEQKHIRLYKEILK